MENEKVFLEEVMKRYLEINMCVKRMEEEREHSPGCIVRRGSKKQYFYWQRRVNGKVLYEYLHPDEVQKVESDIKVNQWRERRLKELKHFLQTLGKMLRSIGIHEEVIFGEYEKVQQKKKQEEVSRKAAREIAGKKRYAENYRHMSDRGEQMASKSEVIIANMLYSYGVKYEYERPIVIDGVTYKPDFTIWRSDGTVILWEHAGLLDDPEYAQRFEQKLAMYRKAGYTQAVNLIVTSDNNGAIDTAEVRRMMEVYRLI